MKRVSLLVVLCSMVWSAYALDKVVNEVELKQQIQSAFPQLQVDKVSKSPVEGLYQLSSGPIILYASYDGRYLVSGDIFEMAYKEDNNLTEKARRVARAEALKEIPTKDMIIYKPKVVKGMVMVYTDADCHYCKELHKDVKKLNDLGIEVRYLAFPRQGNGSPIYTKMVSIWCAKNPKGALDKAMSGETVEDKVCNISIDNQIMLGQKCGIQGTPALVFADGTLLLGYRSPDKVAKEAILHSVQK